MLQAQCGQKRRHAGGFVDIEESSEGVEKGIAS
jgi:hypothetical protein